MKIEPVGVERDRQIAEIIFGKPISELIKEGISIKAWSTEFTASIALWAEMKGVGDIDLDYKKRKGNCFCRLGVGGEVHEDYDIEISHFGDTEADAISGVYVEWKGGDNG